MDKAGHTHTTIVASDTNFQVCDDFVKNKTVSDAIGTCRHDTKDSNNCILRLSTVVLCSTVVLYSTAILYSIALY